ncbi:MAG: ABC transporter permease, partial [Leeuwenhoekiella sp.]
MFKNYIKIAWRSILKNKGIFSINIAGLALGIAACLLIMLFVVDELSYDRFNKKADDIVRVVFKAKINAEVMKEATVMPPVAHALKNDIPDVLDATRIINAGNPKIMYANKSYRDSRFAYVDPNFFQVFTLPILRGDSNNPLKEPNSIVLTETEAKKYFGNQNPIGQILNLPDQNAQYNITAIIKDIPKNSHFHFDMLASMQGYAPAKENSWVTSGYYTYLLLKDGANYKSVEAKLPALCEKYMG